MLTDTELKMLGTMSHNFSKAIKIHFTACQSALPLKLYKKKIVKSVNHHLF